MQPPAFQQKGAWKRFFTLTHTSCFLYSVLEQSLEYEKVALEKRAARKLEVCNFHSKYLLITAISHHPWLIYFLSVLLLFYTLLRPTQVLVVYVNRVAKQEALLWGPLAPEVKVIFIFSIDNVNWLTAGVLQGLGGHDGVSWLSKPWSASCLRQLPTCTSESNIQSQSLHFVFKVPLTLGKS